MTEKEPTPADAIGGAGETGVKPVVGREDLRAAVSAGILSEAQAASLQALAAQRLAGRPSSDDEPFELFRGFAEIFISVGLVILIAGLMAMAAVANSVIGFCLAGVVLSLVFARYFTLKRRMVLPSIVLLGAYTVSMLGVIVTFLLSSLSKEALLTQGIYLVPIAMMAALLVWYRLFRLPFTMLLIALTGFWLALAVLAPGEFAMFLGSSGMDAALSLTSGSGIGVASLIAGLVAAGTGLWFDMRDPHRLGRASASAFWLHLVAAPLIVNTLAQTAIAQRGGVQYPALAAVLLCITLFALIIDRRSFLTAGLGYLIWLIWAVTYRDGAGLDWPTILILIGGAVTALGAWWVPLRAALMRALPDFPGKDRLPPYAKGAL